MEFKKDVLYVDSREPEQIFQKLEGQRIPYEKTHLLVGDFMFNDFIFERKTMEDFYGSIQGRLWEQIENMKENFNNIFVMISGNIADCVLDIENFNDNIIIGAVASLVAKQRIQVIRCDTDTILVRQIARICQKSTEPYTGFVKRIQMTEKDVELAQIACIPSIGLTKAKLIREKYTPYQLYSVTVEELCEIKGIGEKRAKNLKRFFKKS